MNGSGAITGLGQVAVPVQDLSRAVAFYRDVVSLPQLFEVPGMAFFDCGGVRLMLAVPEAEEAGADGVVLYFSVPDIRAAHAALARAGVTFERDPHLIARMPDHELWMAFFRDSEKNLMALMSEVRESNGGSRREAQA
jgi:methylmalonyl-CoA/ethylmalonyl-CoA epimerase